MGAQFALQQIIDRAPVCIVAGHYGVGKTNTAINMALDAVQAGYSITLIDLDVVNPYFRSSEYADELENQGVKVISPVFARAGSNLDVPSLSPQVGPAIRFAQARFAEGGRERVIIDTGGDDAGAGALGRYAGDIENAPYEFVYVVNRYRNLTQDVAHAVQILREVECASHLQATIVLNNSHMQQETTCQLVDDAAHFGRAVAEETKLPLAATTIPRESLEGTLACQLPALNTMTLYPIRIIVRTPWE